MWCLKSQQRYLDTLIWGSCSLQFQAHTLRTAVPGPSFLQQRHPVTGGPSTVLPVIRGSRCSQGSIFNIPLKYDFTPNVYDPTEKLLSLSSLNMFKSFNSCHKYEYLSQFLFYISRTNDADCSMTQLWTCCILEAAEKREDPLYL